MTERSNGTLRERARVTPFVRTELSRLEGVRIENGDKSLIIRALDENRIAVVERAGEDLKRPDVFTLPDSETYCHEISEGKVVSISGGKSGINGRQFVMYIPTELKVTKTIIGAQKK